MTKDAESACRVSEGAGDLLGGASVDVIGAESFVLAVFGLLRFQKEAARLCYNNRCSDYLVVTVSHTTYGVNR